MEGYNILVVLLIWVGVSMGQIPGGWIDANVGDTDVKEAARFATEELSSRSNSVYQHKLLKIHKARTQVVSGINYEVFIETGTTTCKKSEVPLEDLKRCAVPENGVKLLCQAIVWVQAWIPRTKVTKLECQNKG
ncbi:L-cystatin-like [Tachypleus tridentatus]|uniref:L-cystatin-like n=1 Tax=Tachypleus tridentatus TaxID=6853 RepID=UPI003FD2FADC